MRDGILQFLNRATDSAGLVVDTPEKRLWLAVIIRSILDATNALNTLQGKGTQPTENIKRSARAWFRRKAIKPGSFMWICQFLADDWESLAAILRKDLAARCKLADTRHPGGQRFGSIRPPMPRHSYPRK